MNFPNLHDLANKLMLMQGKIHLLKKRVESSGAPPGELLQELARLDELGKEIQVALESHRAELSSVA